MVTLLMFVFPGFVLFYVYDVLCDVWRKGRRLNRKRGVRRRRVYRRRRRYSRFKEEGLEGTGDNQREGGLKGSEYGSWEDGQAAPSSSMSPG